jgi:uncharacterized membrane protein YbhN (UPF0104 family)
MGVRAEAAGPLARRSARSATDPPQPVDATDGSPDGSVPAPERRNWRRRWRQVVILGIAAVAAVIVLRGRLPTAGELVDAIRAADPPWLVAGLVAEYISLAMFARQQQALLRGLGVPTRIGAALAVTYSRSAIAISMPAGSAVSAGFAYKTFRRWGASPQVATAVMVISGIQSTAGLGLLYLIGFLTVFAEQPGEIWHDHPAGAIGAVIVAGGLAALAGWSITHRPGRDAATGRPEQPPTEVPTGSWPHRGLTVARSIGATAAAMPAGYRTLSLAFAVVNWLADLCCLAAVAQAFALPLTFVQLGTVYVVVQLVRQVPVTPGGMGVIEASLLAALVGAGAGQAPAAAAVLGYRLFSCWLVIPAGLFTWAMLRRRSRRPAADSSA